MRYAMVSDIHANLQAWEAVLRDIASSRIDGIVSLGDVLGYGPNPAEVLQSVHRHVDAFVLGNHDAVVCGKLDPAAFNEHAAAIIGWTRNALAPQAQSFLAEWPLVLVGDGFRCAHGDFAAPGAFPYIIDPQEALPSWQETAEPLLFTGHTHLPGIFVTGASGRPHFLEPQDFVLEEGKRYLVSAGSVGLPRDADPRACYCIFDSNERSVVWRRVPFDVDAYLRAMAAAGLPADANRHKRDPLSQLTPLRLQLDFLPPTQPARQAHSAVPERELTRRLRRGITRWKILAGILLATALAALAVALHPQETHNQAWSCPAHPLAPRPATPAPLADDRPPPNLMAGFASASEDGIPGWRYVLADRASQSATASNGTVVLTSLHPGGHIRLESAPVDLAGTGIRRLCLAVRVHSAPGFNGSLTVAADQTCEDESGATRSFPRRELRELRQLREGEWGARRTFDLRKDTRTVTLALEGTFAGSVTVAELSLVPVSKR
jgi:diadenosine tetraphosphatase ApaH/serine/threonine PP2A family protein phosphatase